ncbi:Ig-like domain-containing protein [Paucibacter sp. APW11]|uniref:Ig-like domain-containing protein n=1 Tax=Roseateles aquae TaxID=3077235 RepID=A0ABU3PCF4_9BURK|nr:Ig-like domain-containing protein [Paucibacter sp. APW11]MDT8999997.1 Ig-like domain-containing protein [Paucibacter sp. APW11]
MNCIHRGFRALQGHGLSLLIGISALTLTGCNGESAAPELPPQAQADSFTVDDDAPTRLDVLANDQAGSDGVLSLMSVGTPAHGKVSIEAGQLRYVPDAGFAGSDSFSYRVSDGSGRNSAAEVKLTLRQSLTLQGLATEAQALADIGIEAAQDGLALQATRSDSAGRFTIKLFLTSTEPSPTPLRLRTVEDKAHPMSHHEALLGSWAALQALAGQSRKLDASQLSALTLSPLTSAEAAVYLRYQQRLDGASDFADDRALRAALQAYSPQTVAEGAALAQLMLGGQLSGGKGVNTVWQLLSDDSIYRQARAAAQAQQGAGFDELVASLQAGIGAGFGFSTQNLPARLVIGDLAAYQQAPLFQPIKDSLELRLNSDGSGSLLPRQSFPVSHAALQWQLSAKGELLLRGSGTETAAGTGIYGDPYHVHLLKLRRIGRTAYGDQLIASSCGNLSSCSLDDAELSLIEDLRLSLPMTLLQPFAAEELPGSWLLPTAEENVVDAHFGAGRLLSSPLALQADGSIAGSPMRWRLDAGDLVLENGTTAQTWRLQRYLKTDAQQHQLLVRYQGPQGQGISLGDAYKQDASLSLKAEDLIAEWRIPRLVRSMVLREDGSANLYTHHDAFDGSWQLQDGVVSIKLQNETQQFTLRWYVVAQPKGALLLVEAGQTPDGSKSFVPIAYRYEYATVTPALGAAYRPAAARRSPSKG